MAATIPRITVTNAWQAISALTVPSIVAGTALKIQHTGGAFVDIVLAAAIPTTGDQSEGEQLRTNQWFAVAASEPAVWVKTSSPLAGTTARLSVQDNS